MFCEGCGSYVHDDRTTCSSCNAPLKIPGSNPSIQNQYNTGSFPEHREATVSMDVNPSITLGNMKTYYLVSAIGNGFAALMWSISTIFLGISTFGCGCLFGILPVFNIAVMILDIIAIGKVNDQKSYSFLKVTSILDIIAGLDCLLPLVMGILNIQNISRPEVHDYYHRSDY